MNYQHSVLRHLLVINFNYLGDLGKELKNLISIMDQEEAAEAVVANTRTAKNKMKIKK